MWQHADRRAADLEGTKGFALPGATRHYGPDQQAAVGRIEIELWIDGGAARIRGRVTIELTALVRTERLQLDAQELRIDRVIGRGPAGDTALSFDQEDARLTITLPAPLAPGDPHTLIIDYGGEPRRGLYFIGPSAFEPGRPAEVWTQGQDEDSRHWFPCFDFPSQKARTELIAHVAPGLLALSNGVLVEVLESPKERVFRYRQDVPHSTYLVSLVVGEYVEIEHPGAAVPVVSFVHPHQLEQGRLTFSRTAEMVELFSKKIGVPYPFPRYAQICVADFIFGGMENTSATTLTEQILFDRASEEDYRPIAESLISHELAHQWWGDLVTCADWSHAWLNEGFATYFETIWREHSAGPAEAAYARLVDQEAYFHESYRRPLVERTYEEPIDLFDRHQYEKGACVLHLLRFVLEEASFWRVLARYAERNRGGIAKTADLERAIQEVTGRNLEGLLEQWVYAPGHPQLTLTGSWDSDEQAFNLTVEQTQRGDRVPSAFGFPVDVEVVTEDGAKVHRARIESRRQTIRLHAPKRPLYVVFDKGGHVLKQVDNRLSSTMLRALIERSDDVHALVHAARVLVKRGDPASVRAVIHAMKTHPVAPVRAEAARALRRAVAAEAESALLAATREDPDPRVRRAAARALAHHPEQAGPLTESLAKLAREDRSDYVAADALRSIGELRAPGARVVLEESLSRTGHNHVIRAAAVEAFAKLRDPSALPIVRSLAGPGHHNKVREAAVATLGAIARLLPDGSPERAQTKDDLVAHLADPWLRVRIKAAEALKVLAERGALTELRDHADRELDGRARRAMRLAERELRDGAHGAEELERLRDELRALELAHGKLQERMEKLESRRRDPAKPAVEREPKKGAKGRKKKKS